MSPKTYRAVIVLVGLSLSAGSFYCMCRVMAAENFQRPPLFPRWLTQIIQLDVGFMILGIGILCGLFSWIASWNRNR